MDSSEEGRTLVTVYRPSPADRGRRVSWGGNGRGGRGMRELSGVNAREQRCEGTARL